MPSVSDNPEMVPDLRNISATRKRNITSSLPSLLRLPKNVYLLLFFTTGKGMQLTIATLTVNGAAIHVVYTFDLLGTKWGGPLG